MESFEGALDFFVAFEVADVVAGAGHLPGVDGGVGAEPGDEAAGGINTATGGYGFGYFGYIALDDIIEGGTAPLALGFSGFLFHREDAVIGIDLCYTALVELLLIGLIVAHDAGCAFLCGIVEELAEAEGEEIVAGHDEEIVVKGFTIYGFTIYYLACSLNSEMDVADGSKAGVVGGGAVVDDGDWSRGEG